MTVVETEPPPRPRWFAAGDPLRGLACMTIVVFHVGFNVAYRADNLDFASQFGAGYGVLYRAGEMSLQVFFVLSSYLIGRSFIHAYLLGRTPPDVRRYLRNRALRVIPAFWAVYTAVLILRGPDGVGAFAVVKLYLFGGLIDNRGLSPTMGPVWSLGVEVAFYLLIPALTLLAIRARRGAPGSTGGLLAVCAVVFAASLAFRAHQPATLFWLRSFPCMAYALMPGIVLAALELKVRPGSVPRRAPALLFAAGLLALGGTVDLAPELRLSVAPGRIVPTAVLTSLGAALLVGGPLIVHWDGRAAWRWLDNRPLHWLGARAFSIFLVHQVVISSLLLRGVDFGSDGTAVVLLALIAVPLSLVAGAIAYHFVERPAMERMKRWQPRKRAVGVGGAMSVTLLLVLAAVASAAPQGPAAVYYEVRMPAGPVRGVTLAFHPGAWCGVSPPGGRECGPPENRMRDDAFDGTYASAADGRAFAAMERAALDAGQIVVASTYASDAPGLDDVVATYDQARARWPDLPISAWGSSAGAHWALMLGTRRRLHAIVGEGAPADFAVWGAPDLDAIFGRAEDYDPARFYPTDPPTPVLLIARRGDQTVGVRQSRVFARLAGAALYVVGPGRAPWVHGPANAAQLAAARAAAERFVQ